MLVRYDRQPEKTSVLVSKPGVGVAKYDECVGFVEQLLGFIAYGMVNADDASLEVVCSRSAAVIGKILCKILLVPCPFRTDILAVEQIAVDSGAKRNVSEMPLTQSVLLIGHLLIAQLSREWEVWQFQ